MKKRQYRSVEKPTLCGNNSCSNIKVVEKQTKKKAIFISRLGPEVTVPEMTAYMKERNLTFSKISKLKTKYDSYSSFYIETEEQMFDYLFNADHWPVGCFMSPFYGKLRNEQVMEPINEHSP